LRRPDGRRQPLGTDGDADPRPRLALDLLGRRPSRRPQSIATTNGNYQAPSGLTIGGAGFGTETSNAAISEVIVYNRVLTDTERRQVEQYLKTRWGIP
jgi:hypothetical protein